MIAVVIGVVALIANSGSHETAPTTQNPPVFVNKDASQLVLTLADLANLKEQRWKQTESKPSSVADAQSAYEVHFDKETFVGYGTYQQAIGNEVAVFPTIEVAKAVYTREKNTDWHSDIVEKSDIGDEAFWVGGIGQRLIFRRANVVVWLALSFGGDIESFAAVIEKKIAQ